jgi:hypothetical protein
MSWTCQCAALNGDNDRFCSRCGQPFGPAQALAVAAAQVQPGAVQPANSSASGLLKLGAVGAVIVLGGLFGSLVAMGVFGGGGAHGAAQTSRNADTQTSRSADTKSTFQQAFEASFKSSCRQSAMRTGSVSQNAADSYCDCALTAFNKTHSMASAVASCKQHVMR